ncbi:MAG: SapC family protein [Pseudomonadales bacterium]|nr:SapC family protein [Pseudomonadales bacterium]
MSELSVVTREQFQNKRWIPPQDYFFAAKDALCPVVVYEIFKASMHLPLGFTRLDDKFHLVAVLGLEPGDNALVDTAGNWTGGYMPAYYRAYPFSLNRSTDSEHVLCIDSSSGLLLDEPSKGEPFFDEQGEPVARMSQLMEFLGNVHANQSATDKLCALFKELDLFEAWPIVIDRDGDTSQVEGLFRISEEKLNTLSPEELVQVRDAGGFPVIYSQLLSMQNLASVAKYSPSASGADTIPEEIQFDFTEDSGNIRFDGL